MCVEFQVGVSIKGSGFKFRQTYIQILALPVARILDKTLNLMNLSFFIYKVG